MRNSMKVAKWEVKRNLKNKSFIIGLLLTPILILGFGFLSNWMNSSDDKDTGEMTIYINDQIGLFDVLATFVEETELEWVLLETDMTESDVQEQLAENENTAYIFINEENLAEGMIPVYTSENVNTFFTNQLAVLQNPILSYQMQQLGLSEEQMTTLSKGVHFVAFSEEDIAVEENGEGAEEAESTEKDPLAKFIPAAFGGIILLSVVFTGMAIFQSASQEKKDKIAEILLSSLTPGELMQGKIIGYFILGLIQTIVLLVFIIPLVLYMTDIPIFDYLFVLENLLYVLLALFNYLMFAAIFVGIGATIEDVTTSGNFQGFVMMLPFLPFIFIGPVVGDPSGIWAQVGTYLPFTAPGVLMLRLAILDVWPWLEIGISLAIIIVSTIVFIKLAGKIFKVGILMYGKNATPGEIWKWLKA